MCLPTLFTGASTCLFFGSIQLFALSAVALLIFLFPFRALALVVGLVLTALTAAFLLNIIMRDRP